MKKPSSASRIAFALGFGLISFFFITVLLASIGFFLHISITIFHFIVPLIASGGLVVYLLKDRTLLTRLTWLGAFAVLVFGSIGFASLPQTRDLSYDGDYYHKIAIGTLKNGWNPIYQTVDEFSQDSATDSFLGTLRELNKGNEGLPNSPWVDHYPKAIWVFAASAYSITGNIESGKAITALSILAVFLLALSFLLRILRGKSLAWLLAAIVALNPIIISQLISYYNDGIMGNLLIILLIALTFLLIERRKTSWTIHALIGMTLILLINIKFTGLLYAGVTAAIYFVWLCIQKDWKVVRTLAIVGVISVVIGVGVLGASSYVKNQITHHNPMYPLYGEGAMDIEFAQQPQSYAQKNRLQKFFESNLGPTANLGGSSIEDTPFKIPFSISPEELAVYGLTDTRQAGYGVWAGGIFIISTLVGGVLLVKNWRRHRAVLPLFLLPIATLGALVFSIGMTWWARYLPHLYIFPVIVVIGLLLQRAKIAPYVIIFALLFNSLLLFFISFGTQAMYSSRLSENLAQNLSDCSPDKTVTIYLGNKDLAGRVYNIADTCKATIKLASDAEFQAASAESKAVFLTDSLYVINWYNSPSMKGDRP